MSLLHRQTNICLLKTCKAKLALLDQQMHKFLPYINIVGLILGYRVALKLADNSLCNFAHMHACTLELSFHDFMK